MITSPSLFRFRRLVFTAKDTLIIINHTNATFPGAGAPGSQTSIMKKKLDNHKKPEAPLVETRTRFQGSFQNPDKEIIKKKGIHSPILTEMPFRIREGKTVRFFSSEQKYRDYLKK